MKSEKPFVLPEGVSVVKGSALDPKILEPDSVDLVVTSPPYNVGMKYDGDGKGDTLSLEGYADFTKKWMKNCYRWTASTGRLCVNVALDTSKPEKTAVGALVTQIAISVGWKYHATIIWNEGNISKGTAWGSWLSARAPHIIAPVEIIAIFYKDEWRRDRAGQSSITDKEFKEWVRGMWQFNGESAKRIGHEAPFPRELPRRCIKLFSYVGDTVLDPFAGSGTTLIEAKMNLRQAVGIELEQKYCDLAKMRVARECGR